ncbi:hypothetical protein [Herpetosiphon llansteffanensis]|uniref:hypothetical protein n=1 Tax=Herpetosiphon llansteffanensis TaxID=2094568 RepID=UPI000D7C3D3D|nr:hypothetical protein [Herpetosiphon llansteffanensis]
MPFTTEQQMTECILSLTNLPEALGVSNDARLIEQLKGYFGIPDLTYISPKDPNASELLSIACELKLSHWQKALIQAYRYRSFVQQAYVIMDAAFVHRALKHLEKFHKSNVGLISVSTEGEIITHYSPKVMEPYCDYLAKSFNANMTANYNYFAHI